MWTPEPPSRSGAIFKITYTELDAARRWMESLDRSIRYSRQIHGDKAVSDTDLAAWQNLWKRWLIFSGESQKLVSKDEAVASIFQMMSQKQKDLFDQLLNESKQLHDKLMKQGLNRIPVPYQGELVLLLRSIPKFSTAADLRARLLTAVRCAEKLLDVHTAWYQWRIRNDTKNLARAADEARKGAALLATAGNSPHVYSAEDPVYQDTWKLITQIFQEASVLYGVLETRRSAWAEAKDEPKNPKNYAMWLLLAAGGYLGARWYFSRQKPVVVQIAVPDAIPKGEP
jgi:hypothetical protein